jgi:hypothetical protein
MFSVHFAISSQTTKKVETLIEEALWEAGSHNNRDLLRSLSKIKIVVLLIQKSVQKEAILHKLPTSIKLS